MEPHPPFLLTLFSLFLLASSTTSISPTKSPPSAAPSTSPTPSPASTLDRKQLRALQSLNIPTSNDPCSQPSPHNAIACDAATPFRHVLSLRLANCPSSLVISTTALKSLSSLTTLSLLNCTVPPFHLPSSLALNLRSFTSVNSLHKLTGVWLSRLRNLTDLTVSGVTVHATSPSIILRCLKSLHSVTISHANLTGCLPKHWHFNVTHIDLSDNHLKGKLPTSITRLEKLQFLNLSSNKLNGEIPDSFGDLLSLQNLSVGSNLLSGSIPDSIAGMSGLTHLDFGSNQLNGTIPKFISEMKELKYLNLENNLFHGVMPFNGTFIKKLVVFKIGGNIDLCYNRSIISSKVKLGIAPCDKHGLPILPVPAKISSGGGSSSSSNSNDGENLFDDGCDDGEGTTKKPPHHHGPSKVVLGVAIGLSLVVFFILFLVLISKWCG